MYTHTVTVQHLGDRPPEKVKGHITHICMWSNDDSIFFASVVCRLQKHCFKLTSGNIALNEHHNKWIIIFPSGLAKASGTQGHNF